MLPYMFSDKVANVTMICDDWLIDQVIDWFGKKIRIEDVGNGKYEITVATSLAAMEYWAMQYLKFVEIKSPSELREKLKKNISEAGKKYK